MGAMTALAANLPDHVPGRLLAVARPGVESTRKLTALHARGTKVNRRIEALDLDVLEVAEESSESVLQSLRDSGLFQFVERDRYAHLAASSTVPNDPGYGRQWHLPQISAPQAWGINTGASAIVIAVIDSGVESTHPDLAGKLAAGWNFLLDSADTSDTLGHGTAVAGAASAASDNGIGVAGVSWNSRIMPLAVVDQNDFAAYSNIATAIQYAADHGARIINISIGGTNSSAALQSAVDYAWSKNAVVFASAMNDSSSQPNYPAACNHVVAVSATDSNDALASFSNYGPWVSLAAPGSNILSTSMGGGYGYWSGTSFSSPIASGVAALALSVNPSLSAQALVTLLEQTTDNPGNGFGDYFGWGRVNAYKAVTAALPPSITVYPGPHAAGLRAGETQQFTATVTGVAQPTVTWTVSPGVGVISSTGLYIAPSAIAESRTITVSASIAGQTTGASTITLLPNEADRRSLRRSK
jgi:thermitase